MCIQCHLNLSDETVSLQLQEALDKDIYIYSEFNSTSINHIIIGASGYNSLDIRNKAIILLNKYYEWLKLNPNYILNNYSSIVKQPTKYISNKNIIKWTGLCVFITSVYLFNFNFQLY